MIRFPSRSERERIKTRSMKDPYSSFFSDNRDSSDEPPHLFEEKAPKGPSKESIRKILDFSRALEVPRNKNGERSPIELIRN